MKYGLSLFSLTFTFLLQACQPIIESPSPRSFARVDQLGSPVNPSVLVMHYTAGDLDRALRHFTFPDGKVSTHYTVAPNGEIYRHVPEEKMAYHAGVSCWAGMTGLNYHSIGIEHVNVGYKHKEEHPAGQIVPGSDKQWYPFDPRQIAASIPLCKQIVARYKIDPVDVVGHSDSAPGRKEDPGPLFPWKQFADAGVGAWPHENSEYILSCLDKADAESRSEEWLLSHLHLWGYRQPDEECKASSIVQAFQMHFRPECIDGKADQETAACLEKLLCEYKLPRNNGKCLCGH